MSGLPRTVVKWLQGLDLTYPIKNPKWDLSNGFLVAEIFSWYYPDQIRISSFNTGQSLDSKMSNWALIKRFVSNQKLSIPNEYIDETLHCKEGAAILLIESLFEILTNRPVQKAKLDYEIDFSDWPYQQQLPFHARSTVAKSLKNNIKSSELLTDPNLKLSAGKAETIISTHVDHRKKERSNNPERFNVKKTLAERCVQRPFPDTRKSSDVSYDFLNQNLKYSEPDEDDKHSKTPTNGSGTMILDNAADKNFKEIRVKQEAYNVNFAIVN